MKLEDLCDLCVCVCIFVVVRVCTSTFTSIHNHGTRVCVCVFRGSSEDTARGLLFRGPEACSSEERARGLLLRGEGQRPAPQRRGTEACSSAFQRHSSPHRAHSTPANRAAALSYYLLLFLMIFPDDADEDDDDNDEVADTNYVAFDVSDDDGYDDCQQRYDYLVLFNK